MTNIPQPSTLPKFKVYRTGFNQYVELLNGRAAMMGFLSMLILEYFTGKGVLTWFGLK